MPTALKSYTLAYSLLGGASTMSRTLVLALVVSFVSAQAAAAPANILGIGDLDCRAVLPMAIDEPSQNELIAWFGGFVSGSNVVAVEDLGVFRDTSGLSRAGILRALVDYCHDHPSDRLIESAISAMQGLPLLKWK